MIIPERYIILTLTFYNTCISIPNMKLGMTILVSHNSYMYKIGPNLVQWPKLHVELETLISTTSLSIYKDLLTYDPPFNLHIVQGLVPFTLVP